jgi:ankyrin repeat protein
MKQILITTIAAVLVVGCGESQQSAPSPEANPKQPTAKVPDISIREAARTGNIEAVKQHLADGTDVDAKDEDGATPLHNAAVMDHVEVVKLLIAEGADVDAKDDIDKRTPLLYAAMQGQKEITELLIAKGADVNAKDKHGWTPLFHAKLVYKWESPDAKVAKRQTADLLRKHGGKTNKELEAEGTPTEPVAEAAKPEPPTAKAPDISIHEAAYKGNIEAVKQHIAIGTDLSAKSGSFRETPLHHAAKKGHMEVVELLIAKDAYVNAKNDYGGTPLDSAIQRNETEIADLLRKHGGKTSAELKAEGK